MAALVAAAERLVCETARADGLEAEIDYRDVFAHCENAPEAVDLVAGAFEAEGVASSEVGQPMRASEDFGRFRARAPTAMFFLGAGETHAGWHIPTTIFPMN